MPHDDPDSTRKTDTWQWTSRRDGSVTSTIGFVAERDRITFRYSLSLPGHDGKQSIHQYVALEWQPCHFGGMRVWFTCPYCDRRAAILYLNGPAACRHCRELTYRSRNQSDVNRGIQQIHKLQERFGGDGGTFGEIGRRPKGMHRRTFEKYRARHDRHKEAELASIRRMYGW